MRVVNRSFDQPMKLEEEAAMALAGGIVNQGYQCGMLWGAALAAGARAYRLFGPGPKAETAAIIAAQRLVESFRSSNNSTDCYDIIEIDLKKKSGILKLMLKGGPIYCLRIITRFAPEALQEINSAFAQDDFEAPSPPVSCSALLAQKMGVSQQHAVIAAGLAGGIGLSGGGCGALGAAIWIKSMKFRQAGDNYKVINSKCEEIIEKFLKNSDYEFECSEIVGRKFENIGDHACFLSDGGCSKIIEALAAK